MNHAELIELVERSSPQERLFLQAYLDHLTRAADPAHGEDLDQRLESMRAGREVSLEDAWQLHEALAARGL